MAHEHEHTHAQDVHTAHCACGCGGEQSDRFEQTKKDALTKIILAAGFFAAGYILELQADLPTYLSAVCFAVSYIIVGFGVVRDALEDMIHKRFFSETFLIGVASLGAIAIKEYAEGCAVMLLYALGEFIQDAVLYRNRKKLRALAETHGFEQAHANSDTERFISRFSKYYSPFICLLAIGIVLIPPLTAGEAWKPWIYRGLSALVIGCPCAIVISVPLAFSCAIGACTREGIYLHCSDALERLHKSKEAAPDELVIPDGAPEKRDFARRAAKKAMTLATENIVAALAVKAAVLVLVIIMSREIPMWLAAFSDVGIALLAILNALRALRIKKEDV